MTRIVALGVLLAGLAWAQAGRAYTFGGPLGSPCHESIAWQALRSARAELDAAAPLDTTPNDQIFIADLAFTIPPDMQDLGGVTLAIGVRDNDLKGLSGLDHLDLPEVHGDPDAQREHCLRRPEHDGPEGSEAALSECRGFILERFEQAVTGLDGAGKVDGTRRMPLAVYLAFRGRVELELPVFYVRLGQAMHALQDGFTHTFRSADHRRVTVVLNWVDALDDFDEVRDGPPHLPGLDLCDDADSLRSERHRLAVQASVELLRVALEPGANVAARTAKATELLEEHLSFQPGCSYANGWCNAPENAYRDGGCGCRLVGAGRRSRASWLVLGLLGLMLLRRPGARLLSASALLGALVAARPSRADEIWPEGSRTGWALHSSLSGAFDNGAIAYSVAGRYAATNAWLVGLDAEYNPWFSIEAARFRRGAFNAYATGIYRYPINKRFALRMTGHLGMSVLLFDLVGAPQGSVGPYLGINLLGLSYELGEHVYFIIDPADVALAAPQVSGAPFIYRQYRLTLGIQLGA